MVRRAAVLVVAACLALFALGVSLAPLQTEGFTQTLSARYSRAAEAGLSPERMSEIAEVVRAYVVAGRGELPATVDGRPGFERAAISHLDDVADVLAAARWTTFVIGVALAVASVTAWRCGLHREVARALESGAAVTVTLPVVTVAIALADFDAFFAGFHSLMFASGTWTFPPDSLLILAFPEGFWVASGVAWALLVLACGGLYAVFGAVVRRAVR